MNVVRNLDVCFLVAVGLPKVNVVHAADED